MKPEFKVIWEEVKANHARLRSCPGPHVFPPYVAQPNARYTCSKCNGSISALDRRWYEDGLAHGVRACGAKLTWTPGEDGFESTCPTCGNHLMGLLEDPAAHQVCLAPRKS